MYEQIVTQNEQQSIILWANENYTRFKKNGPSRHFIQLDLLQDVPVCIWDIKNRIVQKHELQNAKQEPIFRDYIGYITNGGKIHPHKDPNDGNLIHTRYNVIIQLPEKGGRPIYDNTTFDIQERAYIICHAGKYIHHCEKVHGDRARIVLSFGFLIPE